MTESRASKYPPVVNLGNYKTLVYTRKSLRTWNFKIVGYPQDQLVDLVRQHREDVEFYPHHPLTTARGEIIVEVIKRLGIKLPKVLQMFLDDERKRLVKEVNRLLEFKEVEG